MTSLKTFIFKKSNQVCRLHNALLPVQDYNKQFVIPFKIHIHVQPFKHKFHTSLQLHMYSSKTDTSLLLLKKSTFIQYQMMCSKKKRNMKNVPLIKYKLLKHYFSFRIYDVS